MIPAYFENNQSKKSYKVSHCFVMSGHNRLRGKTLFTSVTSIFHVYVKAVTGAISYGGGIVC